MTSLALAFDILAKDHASPTFDKVGRAAEKTGKQGHSFGLAFKAGMAVAAGALIEVAKRSLEMADTFELSRARLEGAIANSGGNFEELKAHIASVDGQMERFGFTNATTESALAALTAATKKPALALTQMGLAADIAKGRNIDLETATGILVKVETGHVALLGRMGIATKDVHGKLISQTEALKRLAQMYGGDANRSAHTFAGQQEALKAKLTDLQAKIGLALIPVIRKLVDITLVAVRWFGQHKTTTEALAGVIGGVLVAALTASLVGFVANTAQAVVFAARVVMVNGAVLANVAVTEGAAVASKVWAAAQWLLNAALDANPIGLVVIAIAALAAGIYEAWHHSETFRRIVTAAFSAVASAVSVLVQGWKVGWDLIVGVIKAVASFIKEHIRVIVAAIFLISPEIGLLIVVAHELYKHWSTVWSAVKAVALAVFGVIKAEVRAFVAIWRAEWQVITTVAQTVWSVLRAVFGFIVKVGMFGIRTELSVLMAVWRTSWNAITSVVQNVWKILKPIFDAITSAAGAVGHAVGGLGSAAKSVGGGVGGVLNHIGGLLGFADGGYVPGPIGAPMPAIVHGGEFVVSNAMQRRLAAKADGGGATYNVVVNNPVPETASDSIPRALRNAAFLAGSR